MKTSTKPGALFWVIAIIGVAWNIMGLYQFYLGTAGVATLKEMVPEAEFAIMESNPLWYLIVFGIAVFTGTLGALMLLLKNKYAVLFFGISFVAVLITEMYWLFATKIIEIAGTSAIGMPIIVVLAGLFYFMFSKQAAGKGWLM